MMCALHNGQISQLDASKRLRKSLAAALHTAGVHQEHTTTLNHERTAVIVVATGACSYRHCRRVVLRLAVTV